MIKQSNIRHLRRIILSLVFVLIAISLTVSNSFGRYSTKVSNVFQCVAATDTKLYITGLQPVNENEDENDSETSEENSNVADVFAVERDRLVIAPEWSTKGGEQYITFTVANSYNSQAPERDVSFRVRVLLPVGDSGITDEGGENSDTNIEYSALNFSLSSNENRYYSRIDNIHPRTAFFEENNISGWMFRFCETINDEALFTLNGNGYDEINFTLSVYDIEFDCSELLIYIDRVN